MNVFGAYIALALMGYKYVLAQKKKEKIGEKILRLALSAPPGYFLFGTKIFDLHVTDPMQKLVLRCFTRRIVPCFISGFLLFSIVPFLAQKINKFFRKMGKRI